MIDSSSQEYKNYNQLKKSLKSMADDNAALSREGGRIQVNQDVTMPDGTVVRAGSHFDNDLSTVDTVSLSRDYTSKTYEHSGQRKWLGLLKTQLLNVRAQQGMNFSSAEFQETSLF